MDVFLALYEHLHLSLPCTARKDAEEKERARWVEILGSMLVYTPTPMGRILGERPGSIQLLGAGRRASTLRSRVRSVRRYLNWSALNHDLGSCDWLLIGSTIRALHEERVAGCSHGNLVHGGRRWSRTVGEADGDTSVRNHPEGDPGQHASEQAGETGSEDAGRDYFNARMRGGAVLADPETR